MFCNEISFVNKNLLYVRIVPLKSSFLRKILTRPVDLAPGARDWCIPARNFCAVGSHLTQTEKFCVHGFGDGWVVEIIHVADDN